MSDTKSKIEEVYEMLLPELAENGIEDTPEHRLWGLEGIYDAWREDDTVSFEKTMWMLAVHTEIMSLRLKLKFPKVTAH
jgi:hypothetical protein